ncbi:MAG: sulfatase [Verrucomicrobiota bacterium]|nr:sulfatase [Verrucomicrobiota bacterium]
MNKLAPLLIAGCAPVLACNALQSAENKTNFVVITADDMNYNSVGCFGAKMKNLTPNIDKLASQGIRFTNAHVASTVCMPSRNAINSGRLPHRSGGEGFQYFRFPDIPTIPNVLTSNGYMVGVLGKVSHSTPYKDTPWDFAEETARNTEVFYTKTAGFIDSAKKAGKPFYFIINSHDPHRRYYNIKNAGKEMIKCKEGNRNSHPSRVIKLEETIIPDFMADTPEIRHELACYYSSVVRCDDVVGRIMDLLKEKGVVDNTVVFFLSDHGVGMPHAKANAYINSTKTPFIVRWPRHIKPHSVHSDNFISTMDIFPTILQIAGIKSPGNVDGESLIPVFEGKKLKNRDKMGTQFYATIGKAIYNMRTFQDKHFAFIFNPFCTGKRTYKSSALGGACFKAMMQDPKYKERCEFILRRVPEEFYDIEKDPACQKNLINNIEYVGIIKEFRKLMQDNMEKTDDPMLAVFDAYQKNHSVDKMHKQFLETIEESGQIGRDPKIVNIARWTDPDYKKKKRNAKRNKKKLTDLERKARRKAQRESKEKL